MRIVSPCIRGCKMDTLRYPLLHPQSIALKRLDSSLISGSLLAPRIKPCTAVWPEEQGQHSGHRVIEKAELLIWPRKGEPRKSRNARRRVPIGALLSASDLRELRSWCDERLQDEGVASDDHLFAVPNENIASLAKIPNSLSIN